MVGGGTKRDKKIRNQSAGGGEATRGSFPALGPNLFGGRSGSPNTTALSPPPGTVLRGGGKRWLLESWWHWGGWGGERGDKTRSWGPKGDKVGGWTRGSGGASVFPALLHSSTPLPPRICSGTRWGGVGVGAPPETTAGGKRAPSRGALGAPKVPPRAGIKCKMPVGWGKGAGVGRGEGGVMQPPPLQRVVPPPPFINTQSGRVTALPGVWSNDRVLRRAQGWGGLRLRGGGQHGQPPRRAEGGRRRSSSWPRSQTPPWSL